MNIVLNGDATGSQIFANTANTYSGSTTLSSGTLSVAGLADGGLPSSIGQSSNAASNLVFNGGVLQYTGVDVSTDRGFTLASGKTGAVNVATAATTLTMAGSSADTSGALIKTGPGTLALTGANLHKGGTTVSSGTLLVNAPGSLSTGTVNVGNAATLGGNGTIGGTVSIASGGILSPGNRGIGTMNVGGLTINSGGIINFEFGSGNDQITLPNLVPLTINGSGSLNLLNVGTATAFATNGTYSLFNTNAVSGGLSNLTITNPVAGKFYSLALGQNAIQLTIGDATTREWNNSTGTGLWTTGGNWIGGVAPNTIGESAKFGTASAGGIVNLNGNKTVSGLIFDNGSGYTLSGTSSTLTVNNGVAAAAIAVNNGSHTIAVPLTLSSASSISFVNPGTSLTISGAIDGGLGPVAKAVSVSGSGTLTFTSDNTYGTTALLNGATLNLGTFGGTDTHGSLGLGDVTMSGGSTLNINRSGLLLSLVTLLVPVITLAASIN